MENDRRRNSRRGNHCRPYTCLQNGDYIRWYSTDPEKGKANRAVKITSCRACSAAYNHIMHIGESPKANFAEYR